MADQTPQEQAIPDPIADPIEQWSNTTLVLHLLGAIILLTLGIIGFNYTIRHTIGANHEDPYNNLIDQSFNAAQDASKPNKSIAVIIKDASAMYRWATFKNGERIKEPFRFSCSEGTRELAEARILREHPGTEIRQVSDTSEGKSTEANYGSFEREYGFKFGCALFGSLIFVCSINAYRFASTIINRRNQTKA